MTFHPGFLQTAVVAQTITIDSGSGNQTVPQYNILTVEIWGGGAGAQGFSDAGSTQNGTAGGASSVSTLGMTANGGTNVLTGGTASGGNTTNTTGNSGANGSSQNSPTPGVGGTGGGSPNGGADRTGPSADADAPGNAGNAPGGSGSGSVFDFPGTPDINLASRGNGGGGYSKSVYTRGVTSGAPAIGALLAYSVGAGGTGGGGTRAKGGAGANGRVRFTIA